MPHTSCNREEENLKIWLGQGQLVRKYAEKFLAAYITGKMTLVHDKDGNVVVSDNLPFPPFTRYVDAINSTGSRDSINIVLSAQLRAEAMGWRFGLAAVVTEMAIRVFEPRFAVDCFLPDNDFEPSRDWTLHTALRRMTPMTEFLTSGVLPQVPPERFKSREVERIWDAVTSVVDPDTL